MRAQRLYQCVALALVLAGLSALVAVSMARTGGMLVYTIDDPYIHLAVAENILRGGYGVNEGAFSAPSSSILYPFILAGLLALGAGDWASLIAAGFGSLVTAWLLSGVAWRTIQPSTWRGITFAALVLAPLLLAVNALALAMTGMEHTLHMAASVAVAIGLYDLRREAPVPKALVLGVILAPLLRYEGLALVIPVLVALLWHRKFAAAGAVFVILAAVLGGFSLFLHTNGQPVLPSSVLAKSYALSTAMGARAEASPWIDIVSRFGLNIVDSFDNRFGTIFGAGIALMILGAVNPGPDRSQRFFVAASVSLALFGHTLIGHFDWFSRYEVYGVAMMLAALIVIFAPYWRDAARSIFLRTIGVLVFLALLAGDYSITLFRSPAGSQNVYLQQYQMHRFATEYFPHTVAVNDLGYVSYRNDLHVLDLWGLGSEKARLASTAGGGRSSAFLREMTESAGAKYAMIYAPWYKDGVPGDWCHVATLKTVKVSVAYADVQVYLIDPALRAEMETALDAFAATLPDPARLDRHGCDPA